MLNSFPPAGIWELEVSSRTVHHVQAWVVGVVMRRESGECHEFPVKLPCGWLSISLVCRKLLTSFWISHRGILSVCCVKSVSMEERESRASYYAILLIILPVSLYSLFLGIYRSPLLMYICVLSNLWHKHIKPQRMALKYIFMYFCQFIFRIHSQKWDYLIKGKHTFNYARCLSKFSPQRQYHSHFYQQCMRVLILPTALPKDYANFWIFIHLIGEKWCYNIVLICISFL